MRFQFDAHQPYQASAIEAVVDLFDGQPADANQLVTSLRLLPAQPSLIDRCELSGQGEFDIATEVGAVGNNLMLDEDTILSNLRRVQDRNGLDITDELVDGLQFDIEMETGTGKTYVYLRTAFELATKYKFNKYIILLASVFTRTAAKSSSQRPAWLR